MKYGICILSVIPLRKINSDKSELISQILFGETFEIIDTVLNWHKITTTFDNYTGWIDIKQCQEIPTHQIAHYNITHTRVSYDLFSLAYVNNTMFPIPLGSTLHNLPQEAEIHFSLNYEGQHKGFSRLSSTEDIIENAYMYLNAPYLWGGRTPLGIDCSGFTQMVYKLCGIQLKRDAYQQAEQGITVDFISDAKAGDLAFFSTKEGKISHVGILLGASKIIHASGFVRIDKIDHEGIYNEDIKEYTHHLRVIKRILS